MNTGYRWNGHDVSTRPRWRPSPRRSPIGFAKRWDVMVTDRQIRGLDALEKPAGTHAGLPRRLWSSSWPVLAAIALAIGLWELVVLSGWKEPWVLPRPAGVLPRLWIDLEDPEFWPVLGLTMRRALVGFAAAVAVGIVLGAVASRPRSLRLA